MGADTDKVPLKSRQDQRQQVEETGCLPPGDVPITFLASGICSPVAPTGKSGPV